MTPLANGVHRQSSESVDLDNLFAFLSEVTPGANGTNSNSNSDNVSNNNSSLIMDDLEEKMDNLVNDLDAELENVLQQEIEGLNLDKNGANQGQQTGTLTRNSAKMGVPTLPEPTMKPPPPPKVKPNKANPACTMGLANESSVETVPFSKPPQVPVPVKPNKVQRSEEPIYEAVIPRQELSVVPEIPEPPPHDHKLRPKSPAVQAIRSNGPQQPRNGPHVMAPSSPKHNRPIVRAQNIPINVNQINGQQNQFANGFSTERAERRKHRVEKKLQEMQTDVNERERDGLRDETYSDFLEFAENHFNTHERSPEGTIMATLTRKGRKSVDLVPKYEMITYYRGNSIQSSHIHMYDPENISVACNIFKVKLFVCEFNKFNC